jgi:hypothetical protein
MASEYPSTGSPVATHKWRHYIEEDGSLGDDEEDEDGDEDIGSEEDGPKRRRRRTQGGKGKQKVRTIA